MKVFKILGLIIFAIVLIIFTVGYASQPVVQIPNADKSVNQDFIIGNINDLISGNVGNIYNVVFFMCVGVSVLLGLGIIIGFVGIIGFTLISKIIFFVVLLLMIIIFIIIQITITGGDIANKLLASYNSKNLNTSGLKLSNGTGYYLIAASTALMFINVIVYGILA